MMIARYASYKAGSYGVNGNLVILDASSKTFKSLKGNNEVASWARGSMVWCADNGIITGVGVNGVAYLMPEESADRASITKIITVLVNIVS